MIYEFAMGMTVFATALVAAAFPSHSYIPIGIGMTVAFELGKAKENAK